MRRVGFVTKPLGGPFGENQRSILEQLRGKLLAKDHEISLNTCIAIITELDGGNPRSLLLFAANNLDGYLTSLTRTNLNRRPRDMGFTNLRPCLAQMNGMAAAIQFL